MARKVRVRSTVGVLIPTPARVTVQLVFFPDALRKTVPVEPSWQMAARPVTATHSLVVERGLLPGFCALGEGCDAQNKYR